MKMYNGVLEKVRLIEQKGGITYAKEDGRLYKTLRVLFIISFIYGMAINLLYILGMLLQYGDKLAEYTLYLITPAACSVLLIVGLVFFIKKFHITASCLTVAPAAVLIFFFKNLLVDEFSVNSVNPKFYWRHLAPMLIIIITVIWASAIAVRAKIKTRQQYDRVCANLYDIYKVNFADGDEINEEQWEEFLSTYDPHNYKPQFLKKEEKREENHT